MKEFNAAKEQLLKGQKINCYGCDTSLEKHMLAIINKDPSCLSKPANNIEEMLHLLAIAHQMDSISKSDDGTIVGLSSLDKLLININAASEGVLFNTSTIEDVGSSVSLPSNVLPYASINYVGGNVHAIKSTSKNLIDINTVANDLTKYNQEIVIFDNRKCLKLVNSKSLYTINFPEGTHGIICQYYTDGEYTKSWLTIRLSDGTQSYMNTSESINVWFTQNKYYADKTIVSITFYCENNETTPIYVDLNSFMVEKSVSPTEYTPYEEYSFIVPDEIINLPNYGEEGSKLDLKTKKFISADGTETDISMYITDNYIKIVDSGTINFGSDIPYSITYQTKIIN